MGFEQAMRKRGTKAFKKNLYGSRYQLRQTERKNIREKKGALNFLTKNKLQWENIQRLTHKV